MKQPLQQTTLYNKLLDLLKNLSFFKYTITLWIL